MSEGNDADWLERLMDGRPGVKLALGWPEDQTLIFGAESMRVATPGMAMRQMPCLRCMRPIAGEPFQLWTLVGPYPCESNGAHLISVSALLHVTCIGLEADEIAEQVRALTSDCFNQ